MLGWWAVLNVETRKALGKTIPDWVFLGETNTLTWKQSRSMWERARKPVWPQHIMGCAWHALWGGRVRNIGFRVYFHDNSGFLYQLDMACKKERVKGSDKVCTGHFCAVCWADKTAGDTSLVGWVLIMNSAWYPLKFETWDFSYSGPVVKNLPSNTGTCIGLIGELRSHMLWGQLSLCTAMAWAPTL